MGKKVDGGGLRFNGGKIDLDQCPTSLIAAVAYNLMKNSNKYGGKYPDANWRKGMSHLSVLNCLQRHLEDYKNGIDIDPTDGVPTLWKVATNVAFLIEYSFTCPELDDRYKGKTASIHDFPEFKPVEKEEKKKTSFIASVDGIEEASMGRYSTVPNCMDSYNDDEENS